MVNVIYKDKVISDINQVAWMTNKRRILDISTDNVAEEDRVVSYSNVRYDVDYITWKIAKVRITDNAEAQYEASTDNENTRWLNRTYKVAVEYVRDILRPYISLSTPVYDCSDNTFTFRFPQGWQGNLSALMNYAHHYIVDFILYEWFRMTMPSEAAPFLTSSADWSQKIIAESQSEYENSAWVDMTYNTAISRICDKLRWCAKKVDMLEFYGFFASNDEEWSLNNDAIYSPHEGTKVVFDTFSKQFCIVLFSQYGNVPAEGAVFYSKFDGAEQYKKDNAFIYNDVIYKWNADHNGLLTTKAVDLSMHPDVLFFSFSDIWKGNFESLGNYIHRYIVDSILYEWFSITLPAAAAVYLTSAEQWKDKIINEARSEDVRGVYFRL